MSRFHEDDAVQSDQPANSDSFIVDLPGINVESGLTRMAGNQDLFIHLLTHFGYIYANVDKSIRNCIDVGNFNEAGKIVHAAKGAAANLSMEELCQAMNDLEVVIKKHDLRSLEACLSRCHNKLAIVLESIEVLNRIEKSGSICMEYKNRSDQLEEMEELISRVNEAVHCHYPEAVELTDQLSSYFAGDNRPEILDALKASLDVYDFDSAEKISTNLRNELLTGETT